MASAPVYQLDNVVKVWSSSGSVFKLVIPELRIEAGERLAVTGVSGCGKSTLLDLLGLALSPTSAERFRFAPRNGAATEIASLWSHRQSDRLGNLRKRHVGYVIQTGALLSFLTVRDNIALSRRALNLPDDGSVGDLARRVGIAAHLDKLPSALSVGERQRVAIARALAHRPSVIIADEPTAALDPLTATKIMSLFLELAAESGLTVIVASHDWERMESLGLHRLRHELGRGEKAGMTVSTFRS